MAATPYTGNPTATEAPAAQPAPGVAPIVNIPSGGDAPTIESITQAFKCLADYVAYINLQALSPPFGDGSDGNVTISTTVTLTRDMFYNNLTVIAGGLLKTAGFRVYVRNTLTTSGGGKISVDGNPAVVQVGGVAVSDGSVAGSVAGGINATNGTNITNALGGIGGGGGTGSGSPGTGGTVTAPAATLGSVRAHGPMGQLIGGGAIALVRGGSGGGGGSGASGGAGGAGGGVLCVIARLLNLASAGDLSAAGGAGSASVLAANGGGGGGGGGLLIVAYATKNAVTFSAATNAPGGAGGTSAGPGVNGSPGANGAVVELALA